MNEAKRYPLATAAALAAGIFVGAAGSVSSLVRGAGFTVAQVCFTQFLAASLILGIIVAIKFHEKIAPSDVLKLILLGMEKSIPVFAYFLSIQFMSVAAGCTFQFHYVWITVLIQCVVEHFLPGKKVVISALLILAGSVLGSGLMDEIIAGSFRISWPGIWASAICSVTYAVFIYASSRTAVTVNPIQRSFFISLGGFIAVTIIMLVTGGFKEFDFVGSIPGGSLMGVLMCVIPFICYAYAGPRLSGGKTAILVSSELPAAVVAGHFLNGEKITPLMIGGVVIILGAVVLSQSGSAKKESEAESAS